MLYKKNMILVTLILLSLVIMILASCRGNSMRPEKALNSLSNLVEDGDTNDLRLSIYYMSISKLTLVPVSVNDLINGRYDYKITIDGSDLAEHADLLSELVMLILHL
jgi:uncharacterized membrane protein YvbJ